MKLSIHPPAPTKGSALVLVIFVTALLGGIVASTLFVIKGDLEKNSAKFYDSEALALANRALSYGAHPQILNDDPLLEYTSPDGSESYSVQFSSEDAKLNLNAVLARGDKPLLRRLFEYWGMETADAQALTDAMADWIDRDDGEQLNGAEREKYQELGFTDRPYNRFFQNTSEISLVLGIAALDEVKPDWEDSFTIFGDAQLDLYEAPLDLLISAAEIEESQAEDFQTNLLGEDEIAGTEDDRKFKDINQALSSLGISPKKPTYKAISARFKLGSTTRRIQCLVKVASTHKEITTIVEQRNNNPVILFQEEKPHLNSQQNQE